jgi:hypothetical protein
MLLPYRRKDFPPNTPIKAPNMESIIIIVILSTYHDIEALKVENRINSKESILNGRLKCTLLISESH